MLELKDYTLEVWVRDRRCRQGKRLLNRYEYANRHAQWMQEEIRDLQAGLYPTDRFCLELHETWVERTCAATGQRFRERYDVPYTASPRSETYWSN
jgi:antirestriction protein